MAKTGKSMDEDVLLIMRALENKKYLWRTKKGLSKETKLPMVKLEKGMGLVPDLIRSRKRSQAGEALYTTRRHFRKTASIKDKILGSITDRAD